MQVLKPDCLGWNLALTLTFCMTLESELNSLYLFLLPVK